VADVFGDKKGSEMPTATDVNLGKRSDKTLAAMKGKLVNEFREVAKADENLEAGLASFKGCSAGAQAAQGEVDQALSAVREEKKKRELEEANAEKKSIEDEIKETKEGVKDLLKFATTIAEMAEKRSLKGAADLVEITANFIIDAAYDSKLS